MWSQVFWVSGRISPTIYAPKSFNISSKMSDPSKTSTFLRLTTWGQHFLVPAVHSLSDVVHLWASFSPSQLTHKQPPAQIFCPMLKPKHVTLKHNNEICEPQATQLNKPLFFLAGGIIATKHAHTYQWFVRGIEQQRSVLRPSEDHLAYIPITQGALSKSSHGFWVWGRGCWEYVGGTESSMLEM